MSNTVATDVAPEPVLAIETSPRAIFLEHCARGELAYQVAASSGRPVFYPRLLEPGTGATDLEWRVSAGEGEVYASTTVRRRGEEPHNVSLVQLDEGFRLMSTVTGIDPDEVVVGQRVRVVMADVDGSGKPLPTFEVIR